MIDIDGQKAALRKQALALRTGFDPGAGRRLCEIVLGEIDFAPTVTVACVWPLPGEMDLRPLMQALHARGNPVVLPQTTGRGEALLFRVWTPGCDMVAERFGTFRPDGALAVPQVIFVPLLAFDRAGHRLGYGGGFYDRTLAALPHALAIGFGYEAQCVDCVPTAPHDRKLAMIATESGIFRA